jgi:ABC-type multidrug transport system permease subunit
MLLGGLMIPMDVLPESVRFIAGFLPSTYAMQAFQSLAFGQPALIDPLTAVLTLAGSSVIAFGLAIFLFNWDSKNSVRRGHPALGLLVLLPYIAAILI